MKSIEQNIIINSLAAPEPGQHLEPYNFTKSLQSTDVAVKIQYRSLYAGDAFFVDNFWGDTRYPVVPGTEYMGTVAAVGEQTTKIKVGDYVGVGYQVNSCHTCEDCLAGTPQYCTSQEVICINRPGALADYAIADTNFVFPIPHKLRKPEYVSLMCAGLTVYSALMRANLSQNAHVGIVGIGNLGHWAVQLGAALGHHVDAFSHHKDKWDKIRELGAANVYNSLQYEQFKPLTRQYDFILVTTYADLDWTQYLSLLSPTGKICFVGLPKDKIAIPSVSLADYAGRSISGGYLGSPSDYEPLFQLVEKHHLAGEVEVYPVSRANFVLDRIRSQELRFSAALTGDIVHDF